MLLTFLVVTSRNEAIDGVLIKTIDYSLKEKWNNTLGSSAPQILSSDTVFKNQNLFLTAIAWEYAIDSNNSANVYYSLKIIKPDNTLYLSRENVVLLNRQMKGNNNLQMSDSILKVSFNNDDVFGNYIIELIIFDKISGKEKKINAAITLSELPSYDKYKVADEKDFMTWFDEYYKKPTPERALSYYIFYSKSNIANEASSFWSAFSIFLEIGRHNSFLLPEIMACYKSQDLKTKIYLLYWLKYSGLGTTDFFGNLQGDEKSAYLKIKDDPPIDLYVTISEGYQLDMLWGTFMASGSYAPVLKLIKTLDYVKFKGSLDNFKKSKQTA